jgi:DNA mismatch repair ATPase MutL
MFYNSGGRRKCLKDIGAEYRLIVDVVTKYAVHNAGVAFNLKKASRQKFLSFFFLRADMQIERTNQA